MSQNQSRDKPSFGKQPVENSLSEKSTKKRKKVGKHYTYL